MNERTADVIVLGAGMVGVCAALHLQQRGRDVVLVDRHGVAGEETSYGNAGLIECASVFPYMFPRDLTKIMRYALNRSVEMRFHVSALPHVAPWLLRYFIASSPERALHSAMAALPLIRRSLVEHEALIEAAGVPQLLQRRGWIKLFRHDASMQTGLDELERARGYGVQADVLDAAAIAQREPQLNGTFAGAIHYAEPGFIPDPGALAKAYAALFVKRGGIFVAADARALTHSGGPNSSGPNLSGPNLSGPNLSGQWRVPTPEGGVSARDAVIALGPWSDDVFRPLGYRLPLNVKRGYHLHLAPKGNAVLQHPLLDADRGFLLAPMNRGIRLTTGAEFARRDAPPTPAQIDAALPLARDLFPLGEAVDGKPWMGARPCLPDMLPVIGPAPRHRGLWFNFGHQHHGLTLGPATGRLLAEMMTGETPFANPAPFSAERF